MNAVEATPLNMLAALEKAFGKKEGNDTWPLNYPPRGTKINDFVLRWLEENFPDQEIPREAVLELGRLIGRAECEGWSPQTFSRKALDVLKPCLQASA